MIRFDSVSKTYSGQFDALKQVSLEIDSGEFIFLTGHSGAGKSTFLRLIALVESPSKGQILVEGRNLVRIQADDKELWFNASVRGDQKAHEIDVDVAGAKELTIEVDYGERYDIGDHILIANPFLY